MFMIAGGTNFLIHYKVFTGDPLAAFRNFEIKVISEAEIQRVAALFWSWMGIIVAGGFITAAFSDLDPWQSFSGMISAMGNMGPFYFSVHKMASLSWVVKFTYIMGMLAGRLEILPLAMLFSAIFRRR